MIVDPFVIAFRFFRNINRDERILLVRTMNDDIHPADLHFASGHDVILEPGILDKLRIYFRRVFDLVEVVTRFSFAKNIYRTVIVVIGKGRFTYYRGAGLQVLLCPLQHGSLVRNRGSRPINCHLFIWAKHPHRLIPEVVARIKFFLDFRRDNFQTGFVFVQP